MKQRWLNLKRMLTLIAAFGLAVLMCFSAACGTKPVDPPSTGGDDTNLTQPDDTQPDGTYKITFHYGVAAGATLDANGRPSAYTSTEVKTSTGKKLTKTNSLTKIFEVKGYEVIGYSDTSCFEQTITSDMDVYVYYKALKAYTIRFYDGDGTTVIKTVTIYEGEELTEADYPDTSELAGPQGTKFCGWSGVPSGEITADADIKPIFGKDTQILATSSNVLLGVGVGKTTFKNYYDEGESFNTLKMYNDGEYKGDTSVVYAEFTIASDEEGYAVFSLSAVPAVLTNLKLSSAYEFAIKYGEGEYEDMKVGVTSANFSIQDNSIIVEKSKDQIKNEGKQGCAILGTAEVGTVRLKKGLTTIRVAEASPYTYNVCTFLERITLSGAPEMNIRATLPEYTLTLEGATFADGSTSAKVKYTAAIPAFKTDNTNGKFFAGWKNKDNPEETWGVDDFRMPRHDITLVALYDEGSVLSISGAGNEATRGSSVEIKYASQTDTNFLKMYLDGANTDENLWVEFTLESTRDTDIALAIKTKRPPYITDKSTKLLFDVYNIYVKYGSGEYEQITPDGTSENYSDVKGDSVVTATGGNAEPALTVDVCNLKLKTGFTSIKIQTVPGKSAKEGGTYFDSLVIKGNLDGLGSASQLPEAGSDITVDAQKDEAYNQISSIYHALLGDYKYYNEEGEAVTISKGDVNEETWKTIASSSVKFDASETLVEKANDNFDATVSMATKGNILYVYIEVTGDRVCSVGREEYLNGSRPHRNDTVEFWFSYEGEVHKIMVDAFGYGVSSSADGLATPYAYINQVQYATRLIGGTADLEALKTAGEACNTDATGYAVELAIPLYKAPASADGLSETVGGDGWGEALSAGSIVTYALQVDDIDDALTTRQSGTEAIVSWWSAYGVQLKADDSLNQLKKITKVIVG